MKVCIVGGVAGGAGAATRLRRLDENAEIIVFEKGEFISYANCGLPYYIGDTIKDEEKLIVTKPEMLRKRFNIDVRTSSEVIAINKEDKKIQVKNHVTGEVYEETYDKLLLSPGAAPKVMFPEAEGMEGVFTLRAVPDTLKIKNYVMVKKPEKAVVVGGGFIGIEVAENLKEQGVDVTIVEFADHVVASLDREMANILHQHLADKGINILLKTGVISLVHNGERVELTLTNKETITADVVLMSVGVVPESKLAKEAGLDLGMRESIGVNDFLQTSDPDIFAVGDAISIEHAITGKEGLIPLAGPANRQARIVAENILGARKKGNVTLGSAVLKVFDLTAASTGLNEAQCIAQGIEYYKTYAHPFSHATYYPGATQISMKMLFDKDGKILGAQAVGYEGVEKRIDVIATAIHMNGTVYDLENLELCYAPPYSSAKDPVNMLGFTASNILRGDMPVIYAEQLHMLEPEKVQIVDVSTPEEVAVGTIPNSINIPVDELRGRLSELDKNKPVYVSCRVGLRGYIATRILKQYGYEVYNLSGGYKTYAMVKNEKTIYRH